MAQVENEQNFPEKPILDKYVEEIQKWLKTQPHLLKNEGIYFLFL